ncbi:cytochrome P450 [Streptomyces sp. NPDC056738]|uniref:cytochrome P450 n=1 Tax=Streptomyces sp. NPDC056738 TaxID=3345933 RepID=UPI0036B0E7BD
MLCPHGLPGEGAPTATPTGPPARARASLVPSAPVPSPPVPARPSVPSRPAVRPRPSPDGPCGPYTPPSGPSARADAPASLLDPGTERDPHPLHRTLRRDFPLVLDEPFGAWLISRHADVRAALADPRLAPPSPGPGPDHGEDGTHAAHRAAVSAALAEGMPAGLRAGVERTAHVLASRLAGRQEADLVSEFCQWLPVAAAVTALGLPYEDTARVHAWCRTGLDHLGHRPGLDAYLRPHLARRRTHPGDDLLSALCAARPGGRPLPDETVTAVAGTVLGAAGGTTARALASFLANLLDHPGLLDLIRARPGLTGAAWAESLRRDPPVQIVPRRALEPIGPIPEGATVACLLGAAGRDPARFADPDRYDLFRADPGALPYGAGPHHCLGEPLARLTAEAGLLALLDVLPGLRRAPGPRPRPEGLVSRSPRTLPVCPR